MVRLGKTPSSIYIYSTIAIVRTYPEYVMVWLGSGDVIAVVYDTGLDI